MPLKPNQPPETTLAAEDLLPPKAQSETAQTRRKRCWPNAPADAV
ncbi:hypothetical protein [uncultured Cardiobacterium sp.]|nr:hypothetical protein [uncultured Cardiobacterium sp.]